MIYNAVYETPCNGKVTGLIRLGEDGVVEFAVNANIPSEKVLTPNLPEDQWLPMTTLGNYRDEGVMFAALNARDGWSLVPAE